MRELTASVTHGHAGTGAELYWSPVDISLLERYNVSG